MNLFLFAVLFGVAYSQECDTDEFSCDSSGGCIPSTLVCDGNSDCVNGNDEQNCPATTDSECSGFLCPSTSECIPSAWLCDGDNDCGDMSDEQGCPVTTSTQCSGFTCNDGECLPDYWQCDSEPDCDGGEDEAGCPCEGFICPGPESRCIPSGWTCDGDNDCGDNSDETEEACPCDDGEERCPTSPDQEGTPGACIPPEYICDLDDIWDCPDGSDQANCTNQAGESSNVPSAVERKTRPETVRANVNHHLSKENEKKEYEQRHAEKRQSPFYQNRSKKRHQ